MYFDKRTETVPAPVTHPELEPVQQHLLEAAEYLRSHGWESGLWRCLIRGSVCMMGAVSKVTEEDFSRSSTPYHEAYLRLSSYAGRCAVAWNDQPGRTVEQVIDLLERAAGVPPC